MGVNQALVVLARELGIDRQPHRHTIAALPRQADRELDAFSATWTVMTLVAYCSGVNTCSSKTASCTSPNTPRVFTLVSTR
jgi:hypothetical protein